MQVKAIKVKNFRNLSEQTIEFGPGLNVIRGENGAGKTNLLEAIYLSSIGRSPRTRKDGELIATGKRSAEVGLDFIRAGVERNVSLSLSSTKPKVVAIDGTPSAKISDVIGNFTSVYFSPDELEIVRGPPQFRRRFMDIVNCQIGAGYMVALRNLLHALKQRNAILQGLTNTAHYDSSLLPWDKQISAYSLRVMLRRANFVRNLDKFGAIAMRILTDNKETLHCTYKTFFDRLTDINVNTFDEVYQSKCRAAYLRDVVTKNSTIGPHHDDIEIKLGYITANSPMEGRDVEVEHWINLRTSGSMGQQRSATLALKIAEMYLYKKFYGEKPVLLLDDVLSELDEDRQRALMEYCNTFNTIITCTEWKYNDLSHKSFVVKKGEVLFDIDKSNANEEKVDFDINSKVALIEQAFENEQLDNMDGG
ncbi:MAG: DNA replication and repair protein RecF [Clostridia bacterium]|nr:DNA replication and repair protein RecF [Clostridia bacterium]